MKFFLKSGRQIPDQISMNKKVTLLPSDLILISSRNELPTSMTSFMAVLKSVKLAPPYNFSYVGEHGTLISNLSLEENILHQLECPDIYGKNHPLCKITTLLENHRNPYLINLFKKIEFPGLLARNAGKMQNKITTLCMAFMSNRPYLLLHNPEGWLGESEQQLLNDIINHERKLGTIILISSDNSERWSNIANKEITRNRDLSFCINNLANDNIINFVPAAKADIEDSSDVEERLSA